MTPVHDGFVPLLCLALAGCQSGEEGRNGSTSAPADRQQLIVAAGEDEFGLRLNQQRLGIYPLNAGICEPLLRLTHDFQIAPGLATSWRFLGGNTYRFTLRRGVKFHDGQSFNANAIKYSLDIGIRFKTQYSFLDSASVRAVDDSTVDITPSIPNLRVLEQLAHPTNSIVAPGSDPAKHPVCTGPFRFVEYAPRNRLTVARNASYWGEKARLETLTFRFMADDNTRALALRSGEVDAIFDVNRSMVSGLASTAGLTIAASSPGAVILMHIATRGTPPFTRMADPVMRRVAAMSIDRKALVERILEGHATVVSTVNPPKVLGRHASLIHGIPYNPAEARRILDSAGWHAPKGGIRSRRGERLSLVMITQPGSVDRAVAQYVQAQLTAVGIEVKLEEFDPGAFESRLNAGTWDIDIEVPNQNDANPAFLLALRWYSRSNVRSARFMTAGPRFDSLVSAALASADHDQTQLAAAEAMHALVDDAVAAIPLAAISRIYAMKSRVQGFDPHPSRVNQSWNTVWLSR